MNKSEPMKPKVQPYDGGETVIESPAMSYYDVPLAGGGKVQAIDLIEGLGLDFNLGCVMKYLVRAGRKPGAPRLDDLRKLVDYAARAVMREVAATKSEGGDDGEDD